MENLELPMCLLDWDDMGKSHRHYVDIYIPSKNKCIEVKST